MRFPTLSPADIRAVRESLDLSQALSANFLGMAPGTVRSWEQGERAPTAVARRLLGVIRDDPAYWRKKLVRRVVS